MPYDTNYQGRNWKQIRGGGQYILLLNLKSQTYISLLGWDNSVGYKEL